MANTTKTETKKPADGDKPANIPAATEFNPSGAPDQVVGVDADHVSVDNNPRENSTEDMNRIDFNEPSGLQSPEETVEEELKGKD